MHRPPLTLGVEEEYMIIDATTRELSAYNREMLIAGKAALGDQLKAEFRQSQIEIGTAVCANVQEVRAQLLHLRHTVNDLAAAGGRQIAAASTHPFSRWEHQAFSEGERYQDLFTDMQEVARRLVIFGMHCHIGLGTGADGQTLIIDVMNQIRYFLPHLLALTTSSPFWHGRATGMKSYRSLIFQNMPRTGIPPVFSSYEEYDHFVDLMAKVGSLGKGGTKDASRLWWDIRPNPRVGTLEIRVTDICTTVDEAVCVTSIIQALTAKFLKLRRDNQSWRLYRSELIAENKWRAVRYGVEGQMIDFGREEAKPVRQLWEEILEFVDDVLDELGNRREVEYVRHILQHGTSADRQLRLYNEGLDAGKNDHDALVAVVAQLHNETMRVSAF